MGRSPMTSSKNYKWYVVAMLWWIAFFNYADRQSIFSLFPLLSRQFRLNDVQLGLLGSSFAAVYGVTAPFAGFIVDRVQRKASILGGLRIWSIICMATALSRSFAALLFFRAAEGLGETIYFPASMSLISDYHGRATRSRAMGLHQTSVYFGTIAGGFFAGLIGQRYGWRSSFVVFGAAGILLSFILSRLLAEPGRGAADLAAPPDSAIPPSPRAEARSKDGAPVFPLWRFLQLICARPSLALCMAGFLFQNFTTMVLFTWMPTLLFRKFHLSLALAGLTATIFVQSASMMGSPLGGWLADTLRTRMAGGRMLTQAIAAGFEVPFVVICALTHSWTLLFAALLLWGGFKGIYEANIFASVFDVVPVEARGTTAGAMNLVGWLAGAGTAPIVVGVLAGRIGLSRSVAVTAAAYAAACILLLTAALAFARRDTRLLESVPASPASNRIG
jgi:sugar phosphate permease